MNEEPTIIRSLEEHLKEYGHTTVGQDIAAAILVIRDLHAANKNDPSSYMIGPQTAARVFKAAGLTDLSDLQAVMDAVERALISDGVPVAWLYEDDLPDNYPYDAMFPYSKVEGVRMFPVYGPSVTIKPLEWSRTDYISRAEWMHGDFMVQQISGKAFALFQFFRDENVPGKMTEHPTRQAAEDAAQSIHNAEVGKYLSG